MDLGWKDLTMPSMPWGSSNTMPFCLTHLAWPGEMNWSMMHWAVLWKSPNWASQSTRAFGLAMAKPSSKPAHNEMQTWGHACSVGIKWYTPQLILGLFDRQRPKTVHLVYTHQERRILTGSCCIRYKEPGLGRCSSWECRSVCRRSDHVAHDADDCMSIKRETVKLLSNQVYLGAGDAAILTWRSLSPHPDH